MDRRLDSPNILETNIFYLTIGLILIFLGSLVQEKNIYTGVLITEYLIILLPTIAYLKIRGYSLRNVLKLNKISFKQAILTSIIVLLSYPVGAFLNSIMAIIISFFGEVKATPIPIPESGEELLISFILFALTAGICEEVMFRGLIMKAYERLGIKSSIIFSAVLFGVFHFNLQNLLGPTFLGLLFGYMVYKTNSIFTGILAHTTNNTIAVLLSYLIGKAGINPENANQIPEGIPYPLVLALGAMMIGIFAVITGTGAYFLLKFLPSSKESYLTEGLNNDDYLVEKEKLNFIKIIPIIIVGLAFIVINVMIYR